MSLSQQISDLRRGCDVVVGTPGRIIDLIENSRALSLAEVCPGNAILVVQNISGFYVRSTTKPRLLFGRISQSLSSSVSNPNLIICRPQIYALRLAYIQNTCLCTLNLTATSKLANLQEGAFRYKTGSLEWLY